MTRFEIIARRRQLNWRKYVRGAAAATTSLPYLSCDFAQLRPLSSSSPSIPLWSFPSQLMLSDSIRKPVLCDKNSFPQNFCIQKYSALDHLSGSMMVQSSRFFSAPLSREIPQCISKIDENNDDKKNSGEKTESKARAEEFKRLQQKGKRLEKEGFFSSEPWRATQLTVARSLFDLWIAYEPFSLAQHREKAAWCTKIVKRWIYHVGSQSEKGSLDSQGDYQLDGLRHYWIRGLKLWKFPGYTLEDSMKATKLLMSFTNGVLPLCYSSSGRCDTATAETVDRAYCIVLGLLAQHWKTTVVAKHADRIWEDRIILDEVLGRTPDEFLWTSYLAVLARCSPHVPQGLERVEQMYREMLANGVESHPRSLYELLFAWLISDRSDAGERAQELLEHYHPSLLYSHCVKVVIDTWGRCGCPEKGEELLWKHVYQKQQVDKTESTHTRDPETARVDSQPFFYAIKAWADSDRPDAAERAQDILVKMQNLYDAGQTDLRPRCEHYEALMEVWSNKADPGEEVERLLRRIQEKLGDHLYEDGLDIYANMYAIAIKAWTETSADEAPERAQNLLNEIRATAKRHGSTAFLTPAMYMRAIKAWALQKHRQDAPERAYAILRQMQDEDGMEPNATVYNAVINAYAQQGLAEQAEFVLDEMKTEAAMGNKSAAPNVASYGSVIHAYSNSGYATLGEKRCRELVQEVEDIFDKQAGYGLLRPNDVLYAFLIQLIGKRSAEDASEIMKHMAARHQANPACPDVSTQVCNTMLRCWALSSEGVAPQRAEALLTWMKEQYVDHGSKGVAPDMISYLNVMRCWVSSRRKSRVEHVERLLLDMISMGMVNEHDSHVEEFRSLLRYDLDSQELHKALDDFFGRNK